MPVLGAERYLFVLTASLAASSFGLAICTIEGIKWTRLKSWQRERWPYIAVFASLTSLTFAYYAVIVTRFVMLINQVASNPLRPDAVATYDVIAHFLWLLIVLVAEGFFAVRACMVAKRRWIKVFPLLVMAVMTILYTAAAVLSATALSQRRGGGESNHMDLMALIVRCAAAWVMVATGIINTFIMYYELVLARKDRRKLATDVISQIANGVLVSSLVLTCISVSSAVASCLIAYPTGIFVMSLFLDTYVPSACACVVWAINQRTRLRRKYVAGFERPPTRRHSYKSRPEDDIQEPADDPANWRSDFVKSHIQIHVPPVATEKTSSVVRPSLRRVSTGETLFNPSWPTRSLLAGASVVKTVEEQVEEEVNNASALDSRRSSGWVDGHISNSGDSQNSDPKRDTRI
ncbi:hypothetical protein OIV83_004850 [Microbotryomycetes sp. JL201]|nr:hypothetical protein OIV83_004850 [Microbotryomycetes sp. JL201]